MNEAELVLTHVLNCGRLSLYLNKDINLGRKESALLSSILKRRIFGEPVQYILGTTEFMGLEFKVDKRALIPRPETEILVEQALDKLKATGVLSPKILDCGTGSGCIAVTIARLLPQADVWASDISFEALQLAEENAGLNNVKVKFRQGDLFNALKFGSSRFDLIISNPPYLSTRELNSLAKEISFEPVLALDAGVEGLDFYRRIISQAPAHLEKGGLLVFEVGINQADSVKELFEREKFDDLEIIKDYNNIPRVLIAKKRI